VNTKTQYVGQDPDPGAGTPGGVTPIPANNNGRLSLNFSDMITSPWFYLAVGIAVGVWLCKSKKV